MEKPKLTAAEYAAAQQKGTVAWVIYRFLWEMNGWGGKPPIRLFKHSQVYTLLRIARSSLASLDAAKLTRKDVIEWVQELNKIICPATANQYVCFLAGALKYAGSNPAWESENITATAVDAAKPFLRAHNLISKSTARTRRPTSDELQALLDYFAKQNDWRGTKVDMVRILLWQNYSSRRISETCKLLWSDWDREARTIVVRGMKDPKRRDKTKTLALTEEAQQMLLSLETIRDPSEPRIFPYSAKTASQRHTLAKKALGFGDLRMHDNRRDRCSKIVEAGYTSAQGIMVSGHDTPAVFEKVYCKPDVSIFHKGPMGGASSPTA